MKWDEVSIGYALWGTGRVLGESPWYIPTMHSFTGLAAFSVAFLALGRCPVLRDPSSYWVGIGFAAYGVLSLFYVLACQSLGIVGCDHKPGSISELRATIGKRCAEYMG